MTLSSHESDDQILVHFRSVNQDFATERRRSKLFPFLYLTPRREQRYEDLQLMKLGQTYEARAPERVYLRPILGTSRFPFYIPFW